MTIASELVTIEKAFKVVRPSKDALKQRQYLKSGRYPVVDQGADLIGGYSDNEDLVIEVDSPLIVFGDHTRCVKWVDFDFVVGADGTKIFKPLNSLDPRFAYYMLLSKELPSRGYARHFALLRKELFWIPSLDVQQRIVETLEDHLSRLDMVTEYLEFIDQMAQGLRKRILDSAASGELLGLELGGGTPPAWREVEFREIASIDSDLRPVSDYQHLPHIAPNNLERDTGRLLDYKTVREDKVISAKHYFKPGQIIYSKIRPYLNKLTIAEFEGLCSADMYPISTSQNTEWLSFVMRSPSFVRKTSGNQNRTVLPKINARDLGSVRILLPPLEVQATIVETVKKAECIVEHATLAVSSARIQLSSLRRSLLHAAFTGQLTTEVPND